MPDEINNFDRVRLLAMRDAAQEALDFSKGRDRQNLDSEHMFRRALVHCIQEIGEAAVRISDSTRELTPQLPWKQIVGMRHRLVHVYFDINLDLVWQVVVKDLPVLVQTLDSLLKD